MGSKVFEMKDVDLNEVKKLFLKSGNIVSDDAGARCKACGEKIGSEFVAIPVSSYYANVKEYAIFHKTCFLYGIYEHFEDVELSEKMVKKISAEEL